MLMSNICPKVTLEHDRKEELLFLLFIYIILFLIYLSTQRVPLKCASYVCNTTQEYCVNKSNPKPSAQLQQLYSKIRL